MPRTPRAAVALVTLLMAAPAAAQPAPPIARPTAGPVPGAPDLEVTLAPDPRFCRGSQVRVTQRRRRGLPASDPALVAALTLEFPRGLSFDPNQPARTRADQRRLHAWLDRAGTLIARARGRYERQVPATNPPAARVEANARIAQIYLRFADALAYAEIPASLASGPFARDAVTAYCDAIADQADSIRDQGVRAAAACGQLAADAKLAGGWWTLVCTPPSAAPGP